MASAALMFPAPQEQEADAPRVVDQIGASVKLCAADITDLKHLQLFRNRAY